ncbi:MAG: pyridoxal-phosphate dependent enzyme [Chloroflexi bacterium]|nr:pyridoxal-phosphate dependent enzyme [Chloroflexota bacterium]
MEVICSECNTRKELTPQHWHCDCGGAWEPILLDRYEIAPSDFSIWRYRKMFGVDFEAPIVQMGMTRTPLLPVQVAGREVHLKLEYMTPTASFKDRGTTVMINILANQGVGHVIEDSSGNAGASVAAYAARAGMKADIFVPASASPAKQAQIAVYGATIHPIPGLRAAAKEAAFDAAKGDRALASHAYHPGFLLGLQSEAWEIYEQLDGKAPDWYVVPVGQGVHLLGVWLGFCLLKRVGLISKVPRIAAVQPILLSPIKKAFDAGLDFVSSLEATQPSVAEGLAIASPVRGKRILQAIRESNGMCITVEEAEILASQKQAARMGFYIEPTSATVIAALPSVYKFSAPGDCIVLPLTGSGLKGSPRV